MNNNPIQICSQLLLIHPEYNDQEQLNIIPISRSRTFQIQSWL